jgi:hypothetical protein
VCVWFFASPPASFLLVPYSCHAAAMQLPCSYHAAAVQLPCRYCLLQSPKTYTRHTFAAATVGLAAAVGTAAVGAFFCALPGLFSSSSLRLGACMEEAGMGNHHQPALGGGGEKPHMDGLRARCLCRVPPLYNCI